MVSQNDESFLVFLGLDQLKQIMIEGKMYLCNLFFYPLKIFFMKAIGVFCSQFSLLYIIFYGYLVVVTHVQFHRVNCLLWNMTPQCATCNSNSIFNSNTGFV